MTLQKQQVFGLKVWNRKDSTKKFVKSVKSVDSSGIQHMNDQVLYTLMRTYLIVPWLGDTIERSAWIGDRNDSFGWTGDRKTEDRMTEDRMTVDRMTVDRTVLTESTEDRMIEGRMIDDRMTVNRIVLTENRMTESRKIEDRKIEDRKMILAVNNRTWVERIHSLINKKDKHL